MPAASIDCSPVTTVAQSTLSAAALWSHCLSACRGVPRAELCCSRTAIEIASNGRSNAQRLRILRSFARLTDAIVLLLTGAATAEVRRRLTASSQPLSPAAAAGSISTAHAISRLGFALFSVRPTSCSSPPSTGSSTSCQERTLSLPCAAIHL